ncbi:hypothetical protein EUTSA_v10001105mg [Eutrema salsugineum]|uniref:Pectinesterase inhibitor domain-containing protein n=1 Tax=Eutrema salsugineum TaxID=72664 RepID=V4L857_EUTSA|nr:pectinesterase inhibitor 12 [Eutrema salsugineum]ESQ39844.1 hypothetical protein EUTSA_v10001105mg [Eutrema salsugineum]
MKFFVSFVMFFLLLNGFATAQTLIQDSCKKAAARDPSFKYDFCVQSLEADPQSKTATSLEGLVIASMKNAASQTINVKGIVEKILSDKKTSLGIEMALTDCIELYTDANDSINEALTNVKSHDYRTANVHLSAAMVDPRTCETGFKDLRHQSPVTNENDVSIQKILISLAFTNML